MSGFGRHFVNLDLFTDAYRVSGRARLPTTGGLVAELSNPNTDYLEVEDAYISRIHEPGKIVASFDHSAFRKDNIDFIVLQDRRDGVPVGTAHSQSVFTRGRSIRAFLTMPSFEVEGEIMYEGKPEPSAILVQSAGRFQSVFSAKASAALFPEIFYAGDLILVHKERIGIFCLDLTRPV
jgi:hypothetical protein